MSLFVAPRSTSVVGARSWTVHLVLLLVAALVLATVPSDAATTPEDALDEAERRIAELSDELAELDTQRRSESQDVDAARTRIVEIEEILNASVRDLQAQRQATQRTAERVEETRRQVESIQQALDARARAAFMGRQPTFVEAVFSGGDVVDVLTRSTLLRLVGDVDRADIEGLHVTRAQLDTELEQLAVEEEELVQLRERQERLLATAQEALGAEREGLAVVEARSAALEASREDLEAESDRLAAVIREEQARAAAEAAAAEAAAAEAAAAQAAAAEAAEQAEQGASPSVPDPAPQPDPEPDPPPAAEPPPTIASGTGYVWPLCRPVSSEYGPRWGRMHEGIDIDGRTGDTIVAANAGVVLSAGRRGGYGLLTLVDHGDGVVTAYAHQDRIDVGRGQSVQRGQPIGTVGATGSVTGDHLHFETRVDGRAQNPRGYLPSSC